MAFAARGAELLHAGETAAVQCMSSGRGAAWLARLLGVQEVPGSNPGGPTKYLTELHTRALRQQPGQFPETKLINHIVP